MHVLTISANVSILDISHRLGVRGYSQLRHGRISTFLVSSNFVDRRRETFFLVQVFASEDHMDAVDTSQSE